MNTLVQELAAPRLHLPSLFVGMLIVPMSAGFVRGVGSVPRARMWRWLFSGRACALALALVLVHAVWN